MASTFVTLSWNTSGALSTGRGYILQVQRAHYSPTLEVKTFTQCLILGNFSPNKKIHEKKFCDPVFRKLFGGLRKLNDLYSFKKIIME